MSSLSAVSKPFIVLPMVDVTTTRFMSIQYTNSRPYNLAVQVLSNFLATSSVSGGIRAVLSHPAHGSHSLDFINASPSGNIWVRTNFFVMPGWSYELVPILVAQNILQFLESS